MIKVFGISFADVAPGDKTEYCRGWFWAYSEAMALKYGAPMVIVIINSVVPIIFDLLGKFEGHKTKTEETLRTFEKVTLMQYFNIAIVLLLVNMNMGIEFLGGFPILAGEYKDFGVDWYKNIGAALCFTLLVNTASPQVSKLGTPNIKVLQRCWDRGCGFALKQNEDDVYTKKLLETDLENLYTG